MLYVENRAETKNLLKKYLREGELLGPCEAEVIKEPICKKVLFHMENRVFKKSSRKNPAIIIARKGGGKTSFLQSLYTHGAYSIEVTLEIEEAIREVTMLSSQEPTDIMYAENTAKLWVAIYKIATLDQVTKLDKVHLPKCNDYLAQINNSIANSTEKILHRLVRLAKDQLESKLVSFAAQALLCLNNNSLDDAWKEFNTWAKQKKQKIVILIDSLENYDFLNGSDATAIKGLLKSIRPFNFDNDFVDAKLCIPSEMFFKFNDLSSSPVKDFAEKLIIHWHAKELLKISVHRIKLYHHINDFDDTLRVLNEYDISDTKGAESFLLRLLPEKILNSNDLEERPIPYILRHTQLQPRHIIMYLNSITEYALSRGENLLNISVSSVVNGIRAVESVIADDIFSAFQSIYPNARQFCERVLPNLNYEFSHGDLHTVFIRHGKKGFEDIDDVIHVKRMLIEMGIVGQVVDSDSTTYTKAIFEYVAPYKLMIGNDDTMCLHPIFASVFNSKRCCDKNIAVYPFGTDIYEEDHRLHVGV